MPRIGHDGEQGSGNGGPARVGRRPGRAVLAIAIGSLLVVTPCALLGTEASAETAADAGATTLSAAEARSALIEIAATTDRLMIANGAHMTSTVGKRGVDRSVRLTSLRVERARGIVESGVRFLGEGGVGGDVAWDPCGPGGGRDHGTWTRTVHQEGKGAWRRMKLTPNERRSLKLLGRSSAVRWEYRPWRSVTVGAVVRADGWGGTVRRNLRSNMDVDGGTVTATATGRQYVLNLSARRADVVPTGVMRLDVNKWGGMAHAHHGVGSWTVMYGAQRASLPTAGSTVTRQDLDAGCRAAMTKGATTGAAENTASSLNDPYTSGGRKVTARRIREEAAGEVWFARRFGLDLAARSIKGGVRFVGRHPLLAHRYEWTVVVRNGKAVARKVR